jgi:transposase-like protein
MEHQARTAGRTRRRHTPEFKAELVQACRQPGVSLASVALANGVNPSLLRRWVVQSDTPASVPALPRPAPAQAAELQFVPMAVAGGSEQPGAISIEVKRAGVSIAITWPVAQANACAALLRELLR